jgi:hypothetical protein
MNEKSLSIVLNFGFAHSEETMHWCVGFENKFLAQT